MRALRPSPGLSLVLSLVGTAASGQDPATVEVVYRVPGMDRVAVRERVQFASSDGRPLYLDAYLPDSLPPGGQTPAVVLVSGADSVRHWAWYRSLGRLVAVHGFLAVVPDKRYSRGLEGVRAGYDDTSALVEFLRRRASDFQMDPTRICLWTFSAGGYMTAVGLTDRGVRCLVMYYAVLDGSSLANGTPVEEQETILRRYSPLHALEEAGAGAPPMFIVRAGRDRPGLNDGIDRFVATALELNAALTLVNYRSGDHGFDGLNDNERSRQIIAASLQFIREQTSR